jgi:hypothetical protein
MRRFPAKKRSNGEKCSPRRKHSPEWSLHSRGSLRNWENRISQRPPAKPCGPSYGFRARSPKRKRPRLRVPCSPSPRPSPLGEGETFARALIIRPSLIIVCFRNERQRSGDCKCNVRIFQHRANALPLLGERVGVGTKLTPTLSARRLPELSNFANPQPISQFDYEFCNATTNFLVARARRLRRAVLYAPST